MWNHYLVKEFYEILKRKKWVMPLVYGHIDFKNLQYNDNKFTLVLIARRSRQYAGVRYLKRGLNMEGRPANFVEVEQIVWKPPICPNVDPMPQMTSFVQVRGSIPFFWYQEPDPLTPKPKIILDN